MPGTGSYLQGLISLKEDKEYVLIGKPSTYLLENFIKKKGLDTSKTILFGDSLQSDIQVANLLNIPSVLVLTGVSQLEDLKNLEDKKLPQFLLNSLDEIV